VRQLNIFNFMGLDGDLRDPIEDISWHLRDEESIEFFERSLIRDNILLFGRVTYLIMAAYWPMPHSPQRNPKLAEQMNAAQKIVFSRTLSRADWSNTTLVKNDAVDELRKMKQEPGKNMTILGSGALLTQLAEQGLIDRFDFMLDSIAIGAGTPVCRDIKTKLTLKLTGLRKFKSGILLLTHQPTSRGMRSP
jgi:dihydrofolate reductase